MTQWAQSLIRISTYEVETLQKRLAEITSRRVSLEMRMAVLDAEAEVERSRAEIDAHGAMALSSYLKGYQSRRTTLGANLTEIDTEEEGARDALNAAFAELKKFEHVAEQSRLHELAARSRREAAAMDETASRRRAAL